MTVPALDLAARGQQVVSQAKALGFDACGIAAAMEADPEDKLGRWLDHGFHATMGWMAHSKSVRQDVHAKVPGAQSVVVVIRNYHSPRPVSKENGGRVAAYAWGRDYHRVLRGPLRSLAHFIEGMEQGAQCYWSIDSGPVLERTWAERSGVAAIGKNSLALRRDLGSWFFLATIITTVELPPGEGAVDLCGTCTRCLEACPTSAIVEAGVVDARRCLSYHTIENRGEIPADLHEALGDWLFGCDVCQEVCPWNRFAKAAGDPAFAPIDGHAYIGLDEVARMDEAAFNAAFEGSPIRRAKHAGIQRNAAIVRANRQRQA